VQWSSYVTTALASYLIGSFPTGYLLARLRGIDIRKSGSGNIGATNVFRTLGKPSGVLVLLVDALKGFIPAYGARYLFHGPPAFVEYHCITAGFFAIIGHNYTCWLGFKGGKGIATSAGVMIGLAPMALLITLAAWLLIFALGRYVSLASIVAAVILPFAVLITSRSAAMLVLSTLLSILAIYKHRTNMQRLIAGTENRFGAKKEKQ
jgi:glycerol-3-phosphate acyltransferase PlsY